MKKSLYVSFLVVFCPTCCNISDLNKFFTFNDAVGHPEEQSYLTKTFLKREKETPLLLFYFL
jgi:hypothetical protein